MNVIFMDIEYEKFLKVARHYADKIGVGEIAYNYPCKTAYIYMILNESKVVGRKPQLKYAKACGFNTITEFVKSCDTNPKQGDDELLEKIKLQQEIIELQRDKIALLEQRLGEGKQVTENQGPLPKGA